MDIVMMLLRSILSVSGGKMPEIFSPRRSCGVPWPVVGLRLLVFIVVLAAMVKLTVAGVSVGGAAAVVAVCALITAEVMLKLFGPGPEPA